MATSGTNNFSVSAEDLIKSVLRTLNVIGVGEEPIQEDYSNCMQALNLVIKNFAIKGFPLWVTEYLQIPMLQGISEYQLGPTGGLFPGGITVSRPLRIVDGFIRNPQGFDTPLVMLSRQEYDILGSKASLGIPNQFYYNNQLENGILYTYTVPSIDGWTIHATIQRMFDDMATLDNTFDFPQEWFLPLKWALVAELGMEYGLSLEKISYYETKSFTLVEDIFAWSQETPGIYFSPDPQGTIRHGRR